MGEQKRHKVAIIDDEESIRKMLDVALAIEGFEVRTAGGRMRTLVERLMTLARLDRMLETDPEVVDVVAIVEQAVDAFGIIAESPITLTASRDVLILGEPVDLYEAVANLIENALKYGARTPVAVSVTVDKEAVLASGAIPPHRPLL